MALLWFLFCFVSLSFSQWDITFSYSDPECDSFISAYSIDGSQCHASQDPNYYGMYEQWTCGSFSNLFGTLNVQIWDNSFCQGPSVTSYSRTLNHRFTCSAKGDGTYVRENCGAAAANYGHLSQTFYSYANCNSNPLGYTYVSQCVQNSLNDDVTNCSPLGLYFVKSVECTASSLSPFLLFSFLMICLLN